jgi:hypothetical protein
MSEYWTGAVVASIGWIIGLLLVSLMSCTGTLDEKWCKPVKVDAVVVGDPQIRLCEQEACLARCGDVQTQPCEDACDMDCLAEDGEWIVSASWMVRQAQAMARLLEERGEE